MEIPKTFPTHISLSALALWTFSSTASAVSQRINTFVPDTLPLHRSSELPDPSGGQWEPLGPFPAVLDLFDDGSLFVVDTPGHLPGHVNILCRLPDRWLCLAGDAFHDKRLLTGERDVGTWQSTDGHTLCIHLDVDAAVDSILRLRQLGSLPDVEIVAAHDEIWWEAHKAQAFPKQL